MSTVTVSCEQVADLLPMSACIEAVAAAMRAHAAGDVVQPLRSILWQPDRQGALGVMPAYLGEPAILGVKVISVFPGNESTDLESHQGVVLLFEVEHGRLLAIVGASEITAIRTAAASGVATRALARDDARVLAVLGSGTQARTHVEAICCVREIRDVRLWSRNRENARRLAALLDRDVTVAPTARAAVDGADVVCTVTASHEPILEGAWLAPGVHVNAVGACIPKARELDANAVARSRLFCDARESLLNEAGDFLLAKAEGAVGDDHVAGELGEVLIGEVAGRRTPDEITLFESLGIGIEDLASAWVVYRNARDRGVGTMIDLGGRRG